MENQIKIDVGLSAKAEIKAEIPSSSMGRLVDALTDAIRPFTEARGLRADTIRLQREDVLIEIARRAQQRARLENGELHPVPLKTLVPLLEKASLEDPEDEEMLDLWAALLAAETMDPGHNRRWCIDILASIDSWQARLLNHVANGKPQRTFFRIESFSRELASQEFSTQIEWASGKTRDETIRLLGQIPGYTLLFEGENIPNTEEFDLKDLGEGPALLHLEALGLLWVNATSFLGETDRNFILNAQLTPLGSQFVALFDKEDVN